MESRGTSCNTLTLMHIMGEKWTLPVLELFLSARHSEIHFNSLQARLGAITSRELSKILADMQNAGIITKSEYSGYVLTTNGVLLQNFIRSAKELGICLYGNNQSCNTKMCADCELFNRSAT